jgi:FkbM family methyltransferase
MKGFIRSTLTSFLRFLRLNLNIRLPERLYRHLYFKRVIKIDYKNDSILINHFGYKVENELFWSGYGNPWEANSLKLWYRLCQVHHRIADVGANTGVYGLAAKSFNPRALVSSFEPVPRVFEKLKANIELNDFSIDAYNIGLSNFKGKAKVFTEGQEHVYSVTVNKDISDNSNPKQQEEIEVDRMDNIFTESDFPDLIKLDVETHEPEVIEGMAALISILPTMLIEVLSDEVAEKLNGLIDLKGYCIYDVPDHAPIRKLQKIQKATNYNLLLCKAEVAMQLNLHD